jgi:voltage-gated sodium channel type II alpha
MSDDSSSLLEEERSLFRPFTRESLLAIEARIAEELEKQKELEKRRAEGEVCVIVSLNSPHNRLYIFFSY